MHLTIIFFHSLFRWLVLASLLYGIYRAYRGYASGALFSKRDNAVRHWTATIAHIQLVIGMVLYFQSPTVKYFMANLGEALKDLDTVFFSLVHSSLVMLSIVLITLGSAKSKRKETDNEKFKTMLTWFSIALIFIFIAIPWPFSPFANRPYFR